MNVLRSTLAGVAILALSAAGMFGAGVGSASAATITKTINGVVNTASPSVTHLSATDTNACATGGVTSHYQVIAAKLVGMAASTLTVKVVPSANFTANLAVYQGVFLESSPVANCFGDVTGSDPGATLTYTTPTPDLSPFNQPSETFYLVVAGERSRDVGTFSLTVTSTTSTAVILSSSTVPIPPDTTKPVLTVPANITQEATSSTGSTVTYSASATDDSDGAVTPSCSPASDSTFALGTTTVNCSATDAASNKTTGSFTVKVQDTTGPVLDMPGHIGSSATSAAGAAVSWAASATDAVSGSRSITCTPGNGSVFPIGTTVADCSATDAANNRSSASISVQVVDDPPVVTVPANISREATSGSGAVVTYATSATDIVDGSRPVSCSPASGATFPIATTTVTCSSSDSQSHTATNTFTVTVADTTGPLVTVPTNITEEATGADGAAVTFPASATDLVDGTRPVTCAPASGSTFAIGTATVTCSASDLSSNPGHNSFTVSVGDTTGPALSLPSTITTEAVGSTGAPITFAPTARDTVDGIVLVTCDATSGSIFDVGATTVHCSATDSTSNVTNGSFMVNVDDTAAPVLKLPLDSTTEATERSGAPITFSTSARDIVDGALAVICDATSGAPVAVGTTTVHCTATDHAGNTARGSFVVHVTDRTGPTLTLPADLTATATGLSGAKVGYATAATDLVDGSIAPVCTPASGTLFAATTTAVTCTATDSHGNRTAGTFTVTVAVRTPVEVTTPTDAPKVPGSTILITASGLAPNEPYSITLDGKVVTTGHANSAGKVSVKITLPNSLKPGIHTIAVIGSNNAQHGVIKFRTVQRVKKFTITATPSPTVQANRMLTLTVRGLAAGEPMKVVYNGHRISPKKAKGTKSGTYRIVVSAGYNWGYRTVAATGVIPTRHGTAKVAVGPRLSTGARTAR